MENLAISRLKNSALSSCKFHGHKMGNWHESFLPGYVGLSACKNCGKLVIIELHPLPNSINIGGGAVASGCILDVD